MKKDVLLRISGLQTDIDSEESVELTTTGSYYLKNGKHYILYDEISDEDELIKNILKVTPNTVELTKKGGTTSHMIFEKGRENLSYYDTPFGSLLLGIDTGEISLEEMDDKMKLKVNYNLSINSEHVSHCIIDVDIESNPKNGFEA